MKKGKRSTKSISMSKLGHRQTERINDRINKVSVGYNNLDLKNMFKNIKKYEPLLGSQECENTPKSELYLSKR